MYEENFNKSYLNKEKSQIQEGAKHNLICLDTWRRLIGPNAKLYLFLSVKNVKDVEQEN